MNNTGAGFVKKGIFFNFKTVFYEKTLFLNFFISLYFTIMYKLLYFTRIIYK